MTKGHKGHDKGQMSDREAMKLMQYNSSTTF